MCLLLRFSFEPVITAAGSFLNEIKYLACAHFYICMRVMISHLFFLKIYYLFIYLFIYLFYLSLAASGLSCSTRALCCGAWASLCLWCVGFSLVVAGWFSLFSCGARAPGHVSSVDCGTRALVEVRKLSSCGTQA